MFLSAFGFFFSRLLLNCPFAISSSILHALSRRDKAPTARAARWSLLCHFRVYENHRHSRLTFHHNTGRRPGQIFLRLYLRPGERAGRDRGGACGSLSCRHCATERRLVHRPFGDGTYRPPSMRIPHLRRKTPAIDESDHSPLQGGGESLSCAIALLRTHAKEKTEQNCSPQEVCRFIHMPRASAKWEHLV